MRFAYYLNLNVLSREEIKISDAMGHYYPVSCIFYVDSSTLSSLKSNNDIPIAGVVNLAFSAGFFENFLGEVIFAAHPKLLCSIEQYNHR